MIWKKDATALLAAFATGQTTPSDAVRAILSRIAAFGSCLNAYSALSTTLEHEAGAATERWARGAPIGPLDGLPVIIKDNIVSAGLPAAWGNAALGRRVPDHDERPVARLRAAGVLVIGKGNTPEFAVEGFTDNLTFGATRNPFDPELTPGGSSGGVVAAVAAGMAFAGLGTDGGGSIRRPAGYTGLVGLKPGIGHVMRGGGLAQVLLDFETVGPIARSLRDVRLLDAVLTGDQPATAVPQPARILAVPTLGDAPCDPDILTAFEATVETLRAAGHQVVTGALPYDLSALNAGWGRIGEIGLAAYFLRDPDVARAAAPKYRTMAERGEKASATELYEILNAVYDLRNAAAALWGHDAILMPASAAHPWPAGESHPPEIAGHPVGRRGHAVYTGWVNAAGLPALAFPATVEQGMPIGMQLVGGAGRERWLMDVVEPILTPFRWPDPVLGPM
ncbi:MAG: glutamyl-tRNA amidotransferase [Confluentimicrobium sp.]|uniref:amidase n=1 Tax=Actibacterium sp. TaxID=1872125 RepID=UPI000C505413|nr:amidase [Actibacterium sp.]MBC57566.1 glutamyl-tRNA amidotransferase [Actibacterium sp.]